MDELRLSPKEWHLLSIAYHLMVERDRASTDAVTQRNREDLGERVAAFSSHVGHANKPLIARIEE